jgi:AraC-like DNA-binding protein
MQKRALPFKIVDAPISLENEFPILGGAEFQQGDGPISYLHVHDCLELGLCFEGNGIFMVGQKVLHDARGDVIFINHTEPHLARSAPGTTSRWTWVYLDPVRLVRSIAAESHWLDATPLAGAEFRNIFPVAEYPTIHEIMRRIVCELRDRQDGYQFLLRVLVAELMVLVHRTAPQASGGQSRAYDRIAPALQLLARDYMRPLDVGALARRCGLSEAQLRRVFQRTIGCGPLAYAHDLRLRTAASLLRGTSRSVLEISLEVGFSSLSSFNRAFRTRFGVTPREWRRDGVSSMAQEFGSEKRDYVD